MALSFTRPGAPGGQVGEPARYGPVRYKPRGRSRPDRAEPERRCSPAVHRLVRGDGGYEVSDRGVVGMVMIDGVG
ncbi:hypothetical protein GCM10010208_37150 [Actinomadura livida]|nr:hypothetical protein GCM10010208_37150 [Actinomadura livida]